MLENFLQPIQLDSLLSDTPTTPFLEQIRLFDSKMPDLTETSVALLGLNEHTDIIRRQLYRLSWHFEGLDLVDLGNVRKKDDNFITQILTELIDGNILPIIIGGTTHQPIPQFLAHKGIRRFSNIAIVSETIPYGDGISKEKYISELLQQHSQHIFNLGFLGYQSHLIDSDLLEWLEKQKYDGLRLGDLKSPDCDPEPIIRDADMMFFHLDAIKGSECMGVHSPSPNGLAAEEACRLARYAGMSNKLGSFSITGFHPKRDSSNLTAQLIAQIVWYFISGFHHRKKDYPISDTDMTEYIVDSKQHDYPITFWKSNHSGRWWVQIPVKEKENMQRHRLVPCSYQDYQLACNGEMPNRLLLALERFS